MAENETPEEREHRLEKERLRQRERRANETPEERASRLEREKNNKKRLRAQLENQIRLGEFETGD